MKHLDACGHWTFLPTRRLTDGLRSRTRCALLAGIFVSVFSLWQTTGWTQTPTFQLTWGSLGSGDGQFNHPHAVAVDSSGHVYVADQGNDRIQKFDSNGTFIITWGSSGDARGQFDGPSGVAVDASRNVYVVDHRNHRIQKFDAVGTFITAWGSRGSGNGQFDLPRDVAVDDFGNVYVSEWLNDRMQKFDSNGTFITAWGASSFNDPTGVAVDSSGNVYVAGHTNTNRIQKFDNNGTFITTWGYAGSGDGQFIGPVGVAVDASGRVYVAEQGGDRAQMFDSNGTFLASWGSLGSRNGFFDGPLGVAVDDAGGIYVADGANHRIQKFTAPGSIVPSTGDLAGAKEDVQQAPSTPTQEASSLPMQPAPSQAASAPEATRADPDVRTVALLVGVSEYDVHPNLINPVIDVKAIEKELSEVYGAETETLLNPTRDEFRTSLYRLANRTYEEADQVFVLFSGHGWFDDTLKRGYLALRDSQLLDEDPLRNSFVTHEDVRTTLERLDCRHVLLAVDSCFAGTLDPLVAMAPTARPIGGDPYGEVSRSEFIRRKLAYRTRRYITAGGKEYVPDGRPGQHSPFARQLLTALRNYGGADGVLTLEELLIYLDKVDPRPHAGELNGNEPGSSFVFVAAAPTVQSLTAPSEMSGQLKVRVTPAGSNISLTPVDNVRTLIIEPVEEVGQVATFLIPTGRYRLKVTKVGHETVEAEVMVSEQPQTVNIVMSPRP